MNHVSWIMHRSTRSVAIMYKHNVYCWFAVCDYICRHHLWVLELYWIAIFSANAIPQTSSPSRGRGSQGKCPGARGSKGGTSKKFKLVWKGESEQVEKGRLRTVHQTQHASNCPVGSKTCHVLLDDCQKSQTGATSVESKETRLF